MESDVKAFEVVMDITEFVFPDETKSPPIRAGERWTECFSELPVLVTAAYESEVHVTWERDGIKSVLPRDFFVDIFYPAYLEAK